jgi:hypothetical protein
LLFEHDLRANASGSCSLPAISDDAFAGVAAGGVGQLAVEGGATVAANFAAGSYVTKHYTILSAAGGISGKFGNLVALPARLLLENAKRPLPLLNVMLAPVSATRPAPVKVISCVSLTLLNV